MTSIAISLMLSINAADAAPPAITDSFSGIYQGLEARAAKNDPEAENCLAGMYLHGLGVVISYDKATDYLKKAVAQNDVSARLTLTSIYRVTGQNALNLAGLKDAKKFAGQGVPPAEFYLGMMNLYGSQLTGKPDYAAALVWLKKAAAQDDSSADAMIAAVYRHGWGVAVDSKQARIWLEEAAHHKFDCPAEYAGLVEYLVLANLDYPADVKAGKIGGRVVVRVPFDAGTVGTPVIMVPSGQMPLDQAVQDALDKLPLPSWTTVPSGRGGINLILDFTPGNADPRDAYH